MTLKVHASHRAHSSEFCCFGGELFSSLEFIHSQGRHKLLPETLLKLARIRSYFLEEVKRENSTGVI